MKKRITALLLAALITVFALIPQAFAANDESETEILKVLGAMGVMVGDADGNLNLMSTVKRSEFVKMAVCASDYKDSATANANVSPFYDVRNTHWAAGYVKTAIDAGWVNGYLDGSFKPDNSVLLEEAVTIVLKMLGYTDSDFQGSYPSGQLALYRSLKLNANISASQGNPISRRDCAYLIYNALSATTKDGSVYAEKLGYTIDSSGKVNYVSIYNSMMKGPVVASGMGIETDIGFTPTTVYRNGSLASVSDILPYDVLYTIEDTKTVYAYTDRVTGTIEEITTPASPTTVTVSGKTYNIGTSVASLALSNMGSFGIGDSVTLLLGNDGSVVSLVEAGAISQVIYGVVSKSGHKSLSDGVGGTYETGYIEVISTSGVKYEYLCTAKYYSPGNIVEVSAEDGDINIKKLSGTRSLAGLVDEAGTTLGTYKFSEDIEILDVCEGVAVTVKPSRLANIYVDDVAAYVLNNRGEIDILILNDVTGDASVYGFVTSAIRSTSTSTTINQETGESTENKSYSYTYTVIINGVSTVVMNNRPFNSSAGPVWVKYDEEGNISKLDALNSFVVSNVGDGYVLSNKGKYILASNAMVYEKTKDGYMNSTINKVSDLSKYKLIAYYDKPSSEGGRVRTVVAENIENNTLLVP